MRDRQSFKQEIQDLIKSKVDLESALYSLYLKYPADVAEACDYIADRSGKLLQILRNKARENK